MNDIPPPFPVAQPKTSRLAITSLVLGILAILLTLICIGPLLAIPAIICGHIACSKIKRSGGQLNGQGLAIGGFVTGYVSIALVVLLLPIAIPNFVRARQMAQKNACINNLRQIDGAVQQWALENKKEMTDTPTWKDLKPYIKNRGDVEYLKCPAGGTYTINSVAQKPTCSIEGHSLP